MINKTYQVRGLIKRIGNFYGKTRMQYRTKQTRRAYTAPTNCWIVKFVPDN